jgi:N-acetylmuramic acid 6-phosphate etherase
MAGSCWSVPARAAVVRGALARAKRAGARVMGITCSPESDMRELADVLVELNVGPEVVAGSTRLKAGTVTRSRSTC